MSKDSSYLKRLPRAAQHRGSAARGEIEIITGARDLSAAEAECAGQLKGSALGKGGKRIGILLEDEVRLVVRDAIRFPSGATSCQMRIIGKTQFDGPDGIVVMAMQNDRLLLREIFRHATRSWELESIRGRRENGQTSRQAVRAEVKQELGYPVRRMSLLGTVCPDAAVVSTVLEVFWAELGNAPRRDEPEATEAFGAIVRLTPAELGRRIQRGEVRDSSTITALLLAHLAGKLSLSSARGV